MKRTKISQQQLARELGVSQALVSLVLNGKRDQISEESYQRIWRYALKRGYRPKGMQIDGAVSLATNVGLILRAGVRLYSQSNYFSHIQHGLHTALLERGYYTFFFGSEDDLRLKDLQTKSNHYSLFGFAILGEVQETFLRAIKSIQKNVVTVSATYPGLCHSVMPNETQSLQLLAAHLSDLGHRQFAWIGGNKSLRHEARRRAELTEALEQRDLTLRERYVVELEGGDRLDGWEAAEMMLSRISRQQYPTAWVCLNGLMARGVINCLTQKGWRVPEQISVVAVNATRVSVRRTSADHRRAF